MSLQFDLMSPSRILHCHRNKAAACTLPGPFGVVFIFGRVGIIKYMERVYSEKAILIFPSRNCWAGNNRLLLLLFVHKHNIVCV